MLELKSKEFRIELAKEKDELAKSEMQIKVLQERQTTLANQNAKMSVELVASEKDQIRLQSEIKRLQKDLSIKNSQFVSAQKEMKSLHTTSEERTQALQQTVDEQSKILREYQEKVSTQTRMCTHFDWTITINSYICLWPSLATRESPDVMLFNFACVHVSFHKVILLWCHFATFNTLLLLIVLQLRS